jgi:hypothetical protein
MLHIQERMSAWLGRVGEAARGLVPGARRKGESRQSAPLLIAFLSDPLTLRVVDVVAREFGWALQFAAKPELAMEFGNAKVPTIVLFERDFDAADWRLTLRSFKHWSPRPYVILLSRNMDLNLWDELERVGGSDIVRLPLDREHLIWSVNRALVLLRSRREVGVPVQRRV